MKAQRALRSAALLVTAWIGGRAAFLAMPAAELPASRPPSATAKVETAIPGDPSKGTTDCCTRSVLRPQPPGFARSSRMAAADHSALPLKNARAILAPYTTTIESEAMPLPDPLRLLARDVSDGQSEASIATPQEAAPFLSMRPSVAAWLIARSGAGTRGLAQNGQLGASQAGARFILPVFGIGEARLAANVRASAPLRGRVGKEAAIGLSLGAGRSIPLELIVERRFAIDRGGRNAFALTAVAGLNDRPLIAGWTMSAYGQTGLVGIKVRDAFADGSFRIERALGNSGIRAGAATWAAAQPGASRVDIGPRLSRRLRLGPTTLVVAAEWRQRIAGQASPGSGPVISMGSDF